MLPQLLHHTTKPATFDEIASRCAAVIRGGRNPCVVELASNTAEELASDDAPTITFPLTVALDKIPTLVKFSKVVNVVLLVAVIFPAVIAVVASIAVAAFPVILASIGFVTVKFVNVPTLVKLELITFEASVVPVKVPASAVEVIVISPLPSKATPLIFIALSNLVAVAALPEIVV